LNIGWLSGDYAFASAAPEENFVAALRRLITNPVNLYRGYHYCEFCPPPRFERTEAVVVRMIETPGTFGNGEIRVKGSNGLTYVAPTLILHYVEQHHYSPPDEFVHAVLNSE
jgi:hypothetical protein